MMLKMLKRWGWIKIAKAAAIATAMVAAIALIFFCWGDSIKVIGSVASIGLPTFFYWRYWQPHLAFHCIVNKLSIFTGDAPTDHSKSTNTQPNLRFVIVNTGHVPIVIKEIRVILEQNVSLRKPNPSFTDRDMTPIHLSSQGKHVMDCPLQEIWLESLRSALAQGEGNIKHIPVEDSNASASSVHRRNNYKHVRQTVCFIEDIYALDSLGGKWWVHPREVEAINQELPTVAYISSSNIDPNSS